MRTELRQAGIATSQAYSAAAIEGCESGVTRQGETIVSNQVSGPGGTVFVDDLYVTTDKSENKIYDDSTDLENRLSPKVLIMQPILRFLQLLCENHNPDLQVSLSLFVK